MFEYHFTKGVKTGLLIQGDCIEQMNLLPEKSVDLTIGSPPYAEKGQRYGENWAMPTDEWVPWMIDVTLAAVRITRNVVVWVVNGSVKDGRYLPACEGLVWELHKLGVACERPAIWHKNAPPSRKDWFGNDWEFCLAFRPADSTRYWNWEAIAAPPKYTAGGRFRQRDANGERRVGGEYPQNKLARPRDVIRVTVGGGHLGSKLAHDNEAPFPERIVHPFIATCVPPDGVVADPFCGSGTVPAVAEKFERRWIGMEVRESQIDLTRRRLAEVAA